jgi:hypothetical protein
MTGRGLFVTGFVVILFDLRFEGFDIISDPIGWLLVLIALVGLTRRHAGFVLAAASALAGVVVSLGTVLAPPGSVITTLEDVVLTGVVFGTCTAFCALAASARDRSAANTIRWLELAITVIAAFVPTLTGEEKVAVEGAAVVPFVLVLVVVFAVVIWFLVLAWRVELEPIDVAAGSASTA